MGRPQRSAGGGPLDAQGLKGAAGWKRAASGGQEKTSEWECL